MSCTFNPVKINQCAEVLDLSINNSLLCKSCCVPSRKFVDVKVGETIVSGDLVKITAGEVELATAAADISGVADCTAEATADCPGQVCVYVRDAVLKAGAINYGTLDKEDVCEKLEELRIFTALTV